MPINAHTFTGMVGYYDGLSHPVLGLDHFLAMVSVGIISSSFPRYVADTNAPINPAITIDTASDM